MTFDPKFFEVTCVTLVKDHCNQVPWKFIKVCGYRDPFLKNLNQRSLTPGWPLTPCWLRSHVWLYPRIIASKSHGNTSMYVDTVINFAKKNTTYYIHTTYYTYIHTYTSYVQNEWSHSLFLNSVQARQKCTYIVLKLCTCLQSHTSKLVKKITIFHRPYFCVVQM